MSKLLAFNNDQKVKDKYVKRMARHASADNFIQGRYWEDGKGCHLGCLMESSDPHEEVAEIGIDPRLSYLMDAIFEGLTNKEAKEFAANTIAKTPVGVDTTIVYAKFMVWLMKRVSRHTAPRSDQRKAIATVRKLYERFIKGDQPQVEEWGSAGSAAGSASFTAGSAGSASSASSASFAAGSASSAARSASFAAGSAADSVEYTLMARQLHRILEGGDE